MRYALLRRLLPDLLDFLFSRRISFASQVMMSKWMEKLWDKERTRRTFATFRSVLRSEPSFAPVTMMARVNIAVATSLALTGMIGKVVGSSGSRMIVVWRRMPT